MFLKHIRPTTVSMYNYIQPIIASVIAILIGQDVFSIQKLLSALLVFTGVFCVTQSKKTKETKLIFIRQTANVEKLNYYIHLIY